MVLVLLTQALVGNTADEDVGEEQSHEQRDELDRLDETHADIALHQVGQHHHRYHGDNQPPTVDHILLFLGHLREHGNTHDERIHTAPPLLGF